MGFAFFLSFIIDWNKVASRNYNKYEQICSSDIDDDIELLDYNSYKDAVAEYAQLNLVLCYTVSTLGGIVLRGASFRRNVTYVYNKLPNTLILMPTQLTQENK